MASRGQRRRKGRREAGKEPERFLGLGRTELVAAGVVLAGVVAAAVVAVLLTSGGGGTPRATPLVVAASGVPFSPQSDDDHAILELARRSVDVLPQGQWNDLYDSYTADFQARCSREAFAAVGTDSVNALGAQLALVAFKQLQDVQKSGDTAQGTIVGQSGSAEYTIQIAFQKVGDEWKIAPAPGTAGCQSFNRLSG